MIQTAELEDNVSEEDGRSLSAIFSPGNYTFFFGPTTTQFPVPFFNGFKQSPFFGFGIIGSYNTGANNNGAR
jgi:hypothetical protein